MDAAQPETQLLPERFARWFAARGWHPRAHQLAVAQLARQGRSCLVIAPTGGGKTLAGFLPALIDLARAPARKPGRPRALHTLYISPLKALAVDIARNLEAPVAEMALPIALETRTGDTPVHKRTRQKTSPPDILLTTPEQLALLIASREATRLFRDLRFVILDELHAMAGNKRGHLLSLGLARLRVHAPSVTAIGLSATVKHRDELRQFLVPQNGAPALADLVEGGKGAVPEVRVLASEAHVPWKGHSGRHAVAEVYEAIKAARTVLVFVNTRSQAELLFHELWRVNEDGLAIALHHGSLAVEQRRKVEAAMVKGTLRAVVCTSTLDLGIDWGDVDLVIQMGAPKGASRLLQRIGRANHRLDEPSRALLVPSNRFEVLECEAAREAVIAHVLDGDAPRRGALDVLAQHVLGMACAAPIAPDDLFAEVRSAAPYSDLARETFDRVLAFVATGGYALKTYDRFRRLVPTPDGRLRIAHPCVAQRYRLNVGTIVEAPMLKVRLARSSKAGRPGAPAIGGGGRILGEVEENFIEQLRTGDTFRFAGEVLRFDTLHETEALVTRAAGDEAQIPSFDGGKFPLSTYLADRVRHMIADPTVWGALPWPVREWLEIQQLRSILPRPSELLVETFPHGTRFFMTAYPFEGRLAHQTLGMLLTRRLERARMRPLGFVASEYALQVWGLRDLSVVDMGRLFDEDMLGDDLEAWLAESSLLKRTFRTCAVIAGLIERRFPGQEKSGRQVTFSSDLIYDVLRAHEPDHILLQATREDAATGLLDINRLGALLKRVKGRIVHEALTRVSPLAVPVMLEMDKQAVAGEAREAMLEGAADELIAEATRLDA
jgi:ATP-dependent Lhr-like helicase